MENKEYVWRPNDQSSSTRLKYDLEAEHFYRSFKSAEAKHSSNSTEGSLAFIGLVFSLIFNIIFLIVISILNLVKYFLSFKKSP